MNFEKKSVSYSYVFKNISIYIIELFLYHEIWTHREPLTIFYLPHAELRGHVIVSGFVSYTPSHINHLELHFLYNGISSFFPRLHFYLDLNLNLIKRENSRSHTS